MTREQPPKIVVIDDFEDDLVLIKHILERRSVEVISYGEGRDAFTDLSNLKIKPDLVISDIKLQDVDGKKLIELIRDHFPKLPIIAVSDFHPLYLNDVLNAGANEYCAKDRIFTQLLPLVDNHLGELNNVYQPFKVTGMDTCLR